MIEVLHDGGDYNCGGGIVLMLKEKKRMED